MILYIPTVYYTYSTTNTDAHGVCLTLTKIILKFVHFGEFAVIEYCGVL